MGKICGVAERDFRFGERRVDQERKELGRW